MKKLSQFILSLMFCFSIQSFAQKVLINQTVDHPALAATVKGIIDGLEQQGFKQGAQLELRVESAQANTALASQIASKFVNQNPQVVVGVGTPSAQSFLKYANEKKVKMIFSSITDPIDAHLVKDLNRPGGSVSGVSNFVDLEPQLELFLKVQPSLKRLGILYNPSDLSGFGIVKRLEVLSLKFGITIVKQAVLKTSDIPQAAIKMAQSVDAIFVSNDNTALAALQTIIMIAKKAKIPVYVSDTDAVKSGALLAFGPNQYQVGVQTAQMIAKVLKGGDISIMPVEFPQKKDLYLNEEAAKELGIIFSQDLKNQATKIYLKSEQ